MFDGVPSDDEDITGLNHETLVKEKCIHVLKQEIKAIDKNNLLVVENKGSLTNISLSDPIILNVIKDNLDTPTTVAIKGKTAWVLQAQFGHLFGDEKDIPPGPFEIIGVQYKPSILTKIKKLLNFEK